MRVKEGVQGFGRVYFGWYIVAVSFLANFVTVGMTAYAVGLFLVPMTKELRWTRAEISGSFTLATVFRAVGVAAIGGLLDRRGARTLMVLGGIFLGLGFISVGRVTQLWHFYLFWGVVVTLGSTLAGSWVVNVAISNWFMQLRGRAMALGNMGTSFGNMVMAPLVGALMAVMSWRGAWMVLGSMSWALVVLPAAFVMRRRPEDLGLTPDGTSPAKEASVRPGGRPLPGRSGEDPNWTRRDAMRTQAFWLMVVAFALSGFGSGAIVLHLVPFLEDKGLDRSLAAWAIGFQGAFMVIGKPGWGLLIDKIGAKYVGVISLSLSGLALTGLVFADSLSLILAALALRGIANGAFVILQDTMWADYFGRLTLGAVRSAALPITMAIGATGPPIAGYAWDVTHSYNTIFLVFASLLIMGSLVLLPARAPLSPATADKTYKAGRP